MASDIRVVPGDADAARAEIERTRARMSRTLDEIEDALVRRKARIKARFDVIGRARERPLASVGIALGAGVVLGLLTGGGSRRSEAAAREGTEERRSEIWEARARRLLDIARRQEDEIEQLEAAVAALSRRNGRRTRSAAGDRHASRVADIRESVADRIDAFATTAVRALVDAARRNG